MILPMTTRILNTGRLNECCQVKAIYIYSDLDDCRRMPPQSIYQATGCAVKGPL